MVYLHYMVYNQLSEKIIMEDVYMVAIIVMVIIFTILIYLCSMSGYTTKRKNPDDYIDINKKQRDEDIAQVKAQEKYDNDWGYIR